MLIMMFLIGLLCGLITGLISIGGGIFIILSLILIPPIVVQKNFTMQEIASLSIMQTFFSSLSGSLFYIKERLINKEIAIYLGIPSFCGGIIGVIVAHSISEFLLRVIFAILAVSTAIIMQIPHSMTENKSFEFTWKTRVFSIIGGGSIGCIGGVIGLGAGFIFVPAFLYLYHLPLKKAIGTSLITILFLSTGSLLAKINIATVPYDLGISLIIGGIIGAQLGGRLNKRFSSLVLKKITSFIIVLVSLKILYDLF